MGDIASFCTSIGMFYFFVCKAMKKLQPYTDLTHHVDSINTEIRDIKKELTNNSGTSLKDLVSKIRVDVKSNTELTTTILNRQRWMLDNRSEPIFETNSKGKFTWVNDAFIRLTDRGFKDLKDNNWINILHEDIRRDVTTDWQSAVQSGRNFEYTVKIVDGKNNCFQAKIVAHLQEDGNYIGTLNNIVKNN
jgi:PAS domain-containing protein